jgi:hypothetical protein
MLCRKCRQDKPRTEFNSSKQQKRGYQSYCRECANEVSANFHKAHPKYSIRSKRSAQRRARQWVDAYLAVHPCVDCGEADPIVLEFDHVRGEKMANVCDLARSKPHNLARLMEEIAKCDVRCANCHRRKTARERLTTSHTTDTSDTCLLPLTFEDSTMDLFGEQSRGQPKRGRL